MKQLFEIVISKPERIISKIELSDDNEKLIFHTRNDAHCNSLWTQLAGQSLYATEGRERILYDMPPDPPASNVIEIESDTVQLVALLEYLESDFLNGVFLPKGIADRVKHHISPSANANGQTDFFASSTNPSIQREIEPATKDTGEENQSKKSP